MHIQFPEVSLATFFPDIFIQGSVLDDLTQSGGLWASCSAQILAMWSLIIVLQ